MNSTAGFSTLIPIGLVVAIIALGGGAYYLMRAERVQAPAPSVATTTIAAVDANNPSGCYAKSDAAVYLVPDLDRTATTSPLPVDAIEVKDADVGTFTDLSPYGICFGKDAKHVYRGNSALSWADPSSWSLLWYAKPGPILFYRSGDGLKRYVATKDNKNVGAFADVPDGDAATFVIIGGSSDSAPWAKDKNNVYCDGYIIQGADPASAKLDTDGTHLLVTENGVAQVYDSMCAGVPVAK